MRSKLTRARFDRPERRGKIPVILPIDFSGTVFFPSPILQTSRVTYTRHSLFRRFFFFFSNVIFSLIPLGWSNKSRSLLEHFASLQDLSPHYDAFCQRDFSGNQHSGRDQRLMGHSRLVRSGKTLDQGQLSLIESREDRIWVMAIQDRLNTSLQIVFNQFYFALVYD